MTSKNLNAEIVVVGGGGAGLAAALSAAENGCKDIIVLEKAGSAAGSTAGHLVGFALNSGRIAGENAVQYVSKMNPVKAIAAGA